MPDVGSGKAPTSPREGAEDKCETSSGSKLSSAASPWRWVMLAILSLDICISYLPYYAFVPILRQSMQVFACNEAALNWLCIFYALVYVPGAFLTGPVVGAVGCRWTFVLAMFLNLVGCVLRCGPDFMSTRFFVPRSTLGLPEYGAVHKSVNATEAALLPAAPSTMSYTWLLVGQAICAMGQPFLVNCTSELGADWFPNNERPTAAMVSNLMNFVGSSLSFMLPTLIVEDHPYLGVDTTEKQMAQLLQMQAVIALLGFLATLFFSRPAPVTLSRAMAAPRTNMPFFTEMLKVLCTRDFWIINIQFSIYVALGHAFDAVEGSLLEHYGFSASIASYTAASCAVAAVVSTFVEARYITSAAMYKCALIVSNLFIAAATLIGFASLHYHLHESVFVFAIGVFGLSTPGWGCSCELGSEVCYPAREATVSSLLEVCSNLLGVAGIVITQWLIDAGIGAGVLVLMAGAAACAAAILFCLRGRLLRTEAEEAAESEEQIELQPLGREVIDVSKQKRQGIPCFRRLQAAFLCLSPQKDWATLRRKAGFATFGTVCLLTPFFRMRQLTGFSRFPWRLGDLPEYHASRWESATGTELVQGAAAVALAVPAVNASRKPHNKTRQSARGEPYSVVISCASDAHRLERFRKHMDEANMSFQAFPCITGTRQNVEAAIREGLVPASATSALKGWTRKHNSRAKLIGEAISHLRILQSVANGQYHYANVFEDTEVVYPDFRRRRNKLLASLPRRLDLLNLNVLQPAGDKVFKHARLGNDTRWMRKNIFRMKEGLSPYVNMWIGNYIVTRQGAKKILDMARGYDTFGKWERFDMYMSSRIYESYGRVGFLGFVVMTNMLSMHCEPKDYNSYYGVKQSKARSGPSEEICHNRDANVKTKKR